MDRERKGEGREGGKEGGRGKEREREGESLVWLCFTSHRRGHLETAPHLLSLAKDMKLSKYTVPTGIRTPVCRRGSPLRYRRERD